MVQNFQKKLCRYTDYKEASQLIFNTNQLAGFCMMETFTSDGLKWFTSN